MKRIFLLFSILALLASCGDDEVLVNRTVTTQSLDHVEKANDLPSCTDSLEGARMVVSSESDIFVCHNGTWASQSSLLQGTEYKCRSALLPDSSGYEIECNGEKLGEVLNGAVGPQGDSGAVGDTGSVGVAGIAGTDGLGCSILGANDSLAFVLCGEDTTKVPLVVSEDSVAYSEKQIRGYSQKGPLVKGASVTAYEIRDGKTLMQTGKSYTTYVTSDSGSFAVSCLTLASQYVLLKASGYYRNEVTGNISKSQISLNALTDVSDRDDANINLLTHLEYERTKVLVAQENMSVKKAKKMALSEILNAFKMSLEEIDYSEDISLLTDGEESAALLAISILLQGDRSVGELTDLLSIIGKELAEKGTIKNDSILQSMADWALAQDIGGGYEEMRRNMENWKLGTIPPFENGLRKFWYSVKGVEKCAAENDGAIKPGSVGKVNVDFVCDNEKWRVRSMRERESEKLCLAADEGATMSLWNLDYVCASSSWRFTTNGEKGNMVDLRDGHVYNTVKVGDLVWFAENLEYSDSVATPNLTGEIRCKGTGEPYTCEKYGRLYTWSAAMDLAASVNKHATLSESSLIFHKDICPEGWHIPDTTEWKNFFRNLATYPECDDVFSKLNFIDPREGQDYWINDNRCMLSPTFEALDWGGLDVVGFSVIASGYDSHYLGDWEYGNYWEGQLTSSMWAEIWTRTPDEYSGSYNMHISMTSSYCAQCFGLKLNYSSARYFAKSIRCVKDGE